MSPSDEELLRACGSGDEAAARALVLRHQRELMRFLSRMLGAGDPALDDLVQQSFLAALKSAARFDGRSSVRSWLLGIAHNQLKMELRARARRRRVLELFGRRERAPQAHAADRRETARRIQAAICTLEPNRRAAFVLASVEGRTGREVAEILNTPEGTVRRWLSEARAELREQLADLREHTEAS